VFGVENIVIVGVSEPLTLPSEALSVGGVFLMNRMALIRKGRLDRVGD